MNKFNIKFLYSSKTLKNRRLIKIKFLFFINRVFNLYVKILNIKKSYIFNNFELNVKFNDYIKFNNLIIFSIINFNVV